ncbi:hypothetical protein B4100_0566 [Heyndrickxia coagulans]|nr:hypothetical protein B4100_0566 [Heyndrickxia coagulans]
MLFLAATAKKHEKGIPGHFDIRDTFKIQKSHCLSGRHLQTNLFGGWTTGIHAAPRDAAFSRYIK